MRNYFARVILGSALCVSFAGTGYAEKKSSFQFSENQEKVAEKVFKMAQQTAVFSEEDFNTFAQAAVLAAKPGVEQDLEQSYHLWKLIFDQKRELFQVPDRLMQTALTRMIEMILKNEHRGAKGIRVLPMVNSDLASLARLIRIAQTYEAKIGEIQKAEQFKGMKLDVDSAYRSKDVGNSFNTQLEKVASEKKQFPFPLLNQIPAFLNLSEIEKTAAFECNMLAFKMAICFTTTTTHETLSVFKDADYIQSLFQPAAYDCAAGACAAAVEDDDLSWDRPAHTEVATVAGVLSDKPYGSNLNEFASAMKSASQTQDSNRAGSRILALEGPKGDSRTVHTEEETAQPKAQAKEESFGFFALLGKLKFW